MTEVGASTSCVGGQAAGTPFSGAGGLADEPGSAVSLGEIVLSLQPAGNTWALWELAEGMIYRS